jgi:metal-responsive CopG/Arc/MetJ family transcriptional regulator
MKRTTVSLPEDLVWRLEREAKRRDASVSEIVRQVLGEHFGLNGEKRHVPFAGIYAGDGSNAAERLEELLAETWADDIANDRDR